ncbi:hypothetical protein DCAR_0209687 [Daucus carota subsp. sativus]|uniref:Uncharacterized protein n=1 Tax=Daucus carota subsp. sativus TaxID=79200 RepID=A0A161XKF0_DAUCS|nr:hypothetical protein DCAR_0209687 [Daucus carota subsp. sativus]
MELGQRRGGRALNPGRVQPGPPYNSRPSKPFSHQPIDREKTCPLLLRVFTKVKEVAPEANKKGATLSFAFVYPCKTGRLLVRQVGRTFSNPDPRRPDNGNMSLRDYDFEHPPASGHLLGRTLKFYMAVLDFHGHVLIVDSAPNNDSDN